MNSVCQWTNERKYRVNKLLTRLIERCDQLDISFDHRPAVRDEEHLQELMGGRFGVRGTVN